ncbi:MAG TPA: hypothetical protein VF950_13770 [Planctomycetota bacterium]
MIALALAIALQDGVNEVKVQLAIQKGIEYLRGAGSPDFKGAYGSSDELLLLTFLHAGVAADDPKVKEFFRGMVAAPMKRTYKASLQAMCLEKLDAAKYQERIALCAQFLVDNQCANGQWAYGNMTQSTQKSVAAADPVPAVETPGKPAPKPKLPKVQIQRTGEGPDKGDNSNSQYAALGLRACHDANVIVPKEAVERAIKGWAATQFGAARKDNKVASGGGKVEGWGYKASGEDDRGVYWAMTAGAAGSLVIHNHLLGKSWKNDALVKAGLQWMTENYKIDPTDEYGLYALERFGILYGTDVIGAHKWYPAGAGALINAQKPDGSWSQDSEEWHGKVWDTCFAILFLRKATRPLVASGVMQR